MERTTVIVKRALHAKQISLAARSEIEKRGEDAFREIVAALGETQATERAKLNSLVLMTVVCRQFFVAGKTDLLHWCARLASDASEDVRTAACHTAIGTFSTLDSLTESEADRKTAWGLASRAVSDALENGIREDERQAAAKFIEAGPVAHSSPT